MECCWWPGTESVPLPSLTARNLLFFRLQIRQNVQISNALAQIWHKFAYRLTSLFSLGNKKAPLAGGAVRNNLSSYAPSGFESRENTANDTQALQPGRPFNP